MGKWENFKTVNPVCWFLPKTGASIICVIDLILGLIILIGGIVYGVYLLHPQGFHSLESFEEKFGDPFYFKVKATAKIAVFLICLGVMFHTLGEYGLFVTLRNAITQEDPHQCGLWFEIRISIHIILFGGFTTYGLVMRPDSIASELLTLSPLFLYRTFELWVLKYYEWSLPPHDPNLTSPTNQTRESSVVKAEA